MNRILPAVIVTFALIAVASAHVALAGELNRAITGTCHASVGWDLSGLSLMAVGGLVEVCRRATR